MGALWGPYFMKKKSYAVFEKLAINFQKLVLARQEQFASPPFKVQKHCNLIPTAKNKVLFKKHSIKCIANKSRLSLKYSHKERLYESKLIQGLYPKATLPPRPYQAWGFKKVTPSTYLPEQNSQSVGPYAALQPRGSPRLPRPQKALYYDVNFSLAK